MSNPPDSTTVMILFPDFEALKKEVEKLRTELSMLFLEHDNLLYQECRNIEMAYMLAVGSLEYKAFELECTVRRQKRKSELIQASMNRQEKINIKNIDSELDAEFAEYRAALDKQVEKMNDALERSNGKEMTDEEHLEFKKLYRKIVRALHPDLHPEITIAQTQLFLNAVKAYENGDIAGLRIICEMVSEPAMLPDEENGVSTLIKEKERLSALIKDIAGKMRDIKTNYPYTMKEFVQSPERIAERKKELTEQIERLTETLTIYNERIAKMLR